MLCREALNLWPLYLREAKIWKTSGIHRQHNSFCPRSTFWPLYPLPSSLEWSRGKLLLRFRPPFGVEWIWSEWIYEFAVLNSTAPSCTPLSPPTSIPPTPPVRNQLRLSQLHDQSAIRSLGPVTGVGSIVSDAMTSSHATTAWTEEVLAATQGHRRPPRSRLQIGRNQISISFMITWGWE